MKELADGLKSFEARLHAPLPSKPPLQLQVSCECRGEHPHPIQSSAPFKSLTTSRPSTPAAVQGARPEPAELADCEETTHHF